MVIYGIKNCDTMQKAFKWLDKQKIKYSFHNYKEEGISKKKIKEWLKHYQIDQLINLKSTTYRELTPVQKKSISSIEKAMDIMIDHPSIIKRPVFESENGLLLGFKEAEWEERLLTSKALRKKS